MQIIKRSGSLSDYSYESCYPFVRLYYDNNEKFQHTFNNVQGIKVLNVLKKFIDAGTPHDTEATSLYKFNILDEWSSSIFSKKEVRKHILNDLIHVIRNQHNVVDFQTDTMLDIPIWVTGNEKPIRYSFQINVDVKLFNAFIQSYFLAYFEDPDVGEVYQRQIMGVVFDGLSERYFNSCSITDLTHIRNAFLSGKTWFLEEGRVSDVFYISVKSSFFVKETLITADSKLNRKYDLWLLGFS